MKKVAYAFILLLCLAGGLGVGILRQRDRRADPSTVGNSGGGEMVLTGGAAVGGGAPTGDGAAATSTPETVPTLPTGDAATPVQATAPTAPGSAPGPADISGRTDDNPTGRVFAGGPDPVKSSSRSSRSSRSASGTGFSSGGSVDSGSSGVDSGSGSGSSRRHHGSASDPPSVPTHKEVGDSSRFGTEVFDEGKPSRGSKSRKGKAAPIPVSEAPGGTDDIPVVGDAATPTPASTPPDVAPPAPKFAMAPPVSSGNGDLVFGEGSKSPFLKKITQRQNGERSVVHIDFAGSARYRVFRMRNPTRVRVDLDETEIPGGQSAPVAGISSHVKEISARQLTHADGSTPIARVEILLQDADPPNVSPGPGEQEAQGSIEVVIGGASNEKF